MAKKKEYSHDYSVASLDFVTAGHAASQIKKLLQLIGYKPLVIRRASIAAYEMEMNLVIHGGGGLLSIQITTHSIEIVAEDKGPGIRDIALAMQEGYSTAPNHIRQMGFGAGMGLPNIKKCVDDFEISSKLGEGTCVKVVIDPDVEN